MKIADKTIKYCPLCGTRKEKWNIKNHQEVPFVLEAECSCGLRITSIANKEGVDKRYRYTVWYKV